MFTTLRKLYDKTKQSLQYAKKGKEQKNGIEKNESIKRIIV